MCENDAVLIENAEVNISQYDGRHTLRHKQIEECLQRHRKFQSIHNCS